MRSQTLRLQPLRPLLAALLISTAAPAFAQSVHGYGGLALSPVGDRIATVEAPVPVDPKAHGHEVITWRSAADGHVLRTIDPCATCSYSGLGFAPGGDLVFLARERNRGDGDAGDRRGPDVRQSAGADDRDDPRHRLHPAGVARRQADTRCSSR